MESSSKRGTSYDNRYTGLVNSNYELYQIQMRRRQMLEDRIRETYAEDYGDPLTAGEIIKAGLGAAAFLGSFGMAVIIMS